MSERYSSRLKRSLVIFAVVGLAVMLLAPVCASAKGFPDYSEGNWRCSVFRPSAAKHGRANIKLRYWIDPDEGYTGPTSHTWKCVVSTSKTSFRVDRPTRDSEGRQTSHYKRTSFKKFRAYIPKGDYAELVRINWVWKRNSAGKRYRFIKSISVSKYIG